MNLIIVIFCGILPVHGFLLKEIPMTVDQVDRCSTCDRRACNQVVGKALRDFMTKNQVKLAVESGDVVVTQNLPNQRIDTGHSCSKTAEARDGKITARMVNTKEELDSLNIDYDAIYQDTIIGGTVPHVVKLNANIRVYFGVKILNSCRRVARRTCSIEGSSTGHNKILVNLRISNCAVSTTGGIGYMKFILDADVVDETDATAYKPLSNPKGNGCKILWGLGSINSYIKKYGDSFLGKNIATINKLSGSELVDKLEDVLRAKLKSTITIPVNVTEIGGRKKRSTTIGCKRMKCPTGFTRIGNTDKCQKFMGSRFPNCSQYGRTSTVHARRRGWRTYYWCHIDMVPV